MRTDTTEEKDRDAHKRGIREEEQIKQRKEEERNTTNMKREIEINKTQRK